MIILLEVFPSIFTHTDILFDVLKNKALEEICCTKKIEEVKNVIKKKCGNSFEEFLKIKLENSLEQQQKKRNEDIKVAYKSMF